MMVIGEKRWIVGMISLIIALGTLGSKCERGEPPPRPSEVELVKSVVIVPELRNNTVDAARLIAAESYLLFVVAGEEESSEFSEGYICRQSPMRGSKVERGTEIEVWVGKGPGEEIVPPKKKPAATVKVPSVIGMKIGRAKRVIRRAGLRVGGVRMEPTTEYYEYTVFRQYPGAGRRAPKGSRVNLTAAAALP